MQRAGKWRCDFVSSTVATAGSAGATGPAASVVHGGFVQLVVHPAADRSWFWAYLVGAELGVISVRDHEVPNGRRPEALTVRADGLWAELVCATPDDHWTIGLEAFGVRLDDPADGLRGEVGERLAVGLDLEWEEGAVFGEILLGTDRIEFDGTGTFVHVAGPAHWSTTPGVEASIGTDGLPTSVAMLRRTGSVPVDVLAVVAVPFVDGPDPAHLVRVLGRWTDDEAHTVTGWLDLAHAHAHTLGNAVAPRPAPEPR